MAFIKRGSRAELATLAVLGALGVVCIAAANARQTVPVKEPYEISVIVRQGNAEELEKLRVGMEAAALDLNAELRILYPVESDSIDEQMSLTEYEVNSGTDAIIAMPVNTEVLNSHLNTLKVQVPVVSIENTLSPNFSSVTPNTTDLVDKILQELAAAKAKRVILCSKGDVFIAKPVYDYIISQLNDSLIEYTEFYFNDTTQKNELSALIYKTKADAIVALDSGSTVGIAALSREISKRPLIYGVGTAAEAVSMLENGTITALAVYSDYAMGYMAVSQAIGELDNKYEKKHTELDVNIVTGSTIYSIENEKLIFPFW